MGATFVGYSWNIQGIFLYSIFPEHSPEFHRELFPNIPRIYHGNVPRILHEHIFAYWEVLYDKNHADFHRKNIKKSAWKAVLEELGPEDGEFF